MSRDFNQWLGNFKSSISNYGYYVDFDKIYKSAEKYKVELNILNSLIGSKNIEKDFENIILKYPETLEVIPMLLAVRSNEIFVKEIPSYIIYYSDGVISDFSKITEFVLNAGEECAKANPNLKCINPDYCYVSYLDGEYKEKDIKVRYAQAVEDYGKGTENVKFMKSDKITVVCIYHKGSYENLRNNR